MALTFVDFCRALDFHLEEGQLEFSRVAFDGEAPSDTDLGRKMWGFTTKPDKVVRRIACAVCGRGSGKSRLAGLRLIQLASTVDVSKLARREEAVCPIIGPDLNAAQHVLRFALGAAETMGIRIVQQSADGFTILREGSRTVKIATRAATQGGKSVRGAGYPCAVLDEAAFFRDATAKVNDEEIFAAIRPRLMPGGQIILLSSPWAEMGLLYRLWKRNYGHPADALVAKAPSWLMRPGDEELMIAVEAERKIDPEKCAREYGAEFMSAANNQLFDPRAIRDCQTDEPVSVVNGQSTAVGGDFAFVRNSTAFAAVRVFEDPNDADKLTYELTDLEEHKPEGEPIKVSYAAQKAAEFCRRNGQDVIVADDHYKISIVEHLWDNGQISLSAAPSGNAGKEEVFHAARALLHEGRLRVNKQASPELFEKLLQQMREVSSRPKAGGGSRIESPLWASGEHGDLVSAFVLAVWRARQLGFTRPKQPVAYADELEKAEMRAANEEHDRLQRLERATGMSLLRKNSRLPPR